MLIGNAIKLCECDSDNSCNCENDDYCLGCGAILDICQCRCPNCFSFDCDCESNC